VVRRWERASSASIPGSRRGSREKQEREGFVNEAVRQRRGSKRGERQVRYSERESRRQCPSLSQPQAAPSSLSLSLFMI